MKPGARARPAPSISRAPRSATRPTAAMRSPVTARSPRAASRPLPSQRSAPRTTRSAIGALVAGRGTRRQERRPPSAVVLAVLRGLLASTLEVAPGELGAQDRLVARRDRKGRRHELPHAHQGARDDHAEALGEAERDALPVAALTALGDDVARHLEDRGRHAGEPAPELARCRLRSGGRGEEKRKRGEREPASHGVPSYRLASIDSALHTLSPGPGSTWSCSTLPSFTTMP